MKKRIGFRVSRADMMKFFAKKRRVMKPTRIIEGKKLYNRQKAKNELRKFLKEEENES